MCWAAATLVALVLVDRADAERLPPLGRERAAVLQQHRVFEALRVAAVVGAIVVAVSVALVPTVTDQLERRMWRGSLPSLTDGLAAPSSLQAARRLDMTSRPRLSDRVVFTVEATRPDFWRGDVFDVWDGRSWTRSDDRRPVPLQVFGDRYRLPLPEFDEGARRGAQMEQTFHVETGLSEILFAAPTAVAVEVESDRLLFGRADGTALLGEFGKGAVYTVTSRSALPTADDLRAADEKGIPEPVLDQFADAPVATPPRACVGEADHGRRADDLRQDPRDRALARREHAVLARRAALTARPGRRRQLPVRVACRLVRTGVEQHDRARAQCRHPGPARHRIRARRDRRPLRPFRRARA